MTSSELRKSFQKFFSSKQHSIVPSAPMVVKNDPTLMFTNAGMNQFKDIFLGNTEPKNLRVANSQKCLRVSGKHNDLEEVGLDTYHHTMFEMLGNWSFGDYFKKEAIAWAYEYLVDVLNIPADRLYATIFEGSPDEQLEQDTEASSYWAEWLPADHILSGSKKDNFWEMGDTGPCGPCSEIHVDLRPQEERSKVPGHTLVNAGHHLVIEIWNLVFIQYNRLGNGSLEKLPRQHVDTGMGFERLCMVVQGKTSNYDTDLFQSIISEIETLSGKKYGSSEPVDVAMRVVADHLRAVAFSIADGQLPSNIKAGYVIRRILRRAIRYGYSFLDQVRPFIFELVPALIKMMGRAFPELEAQEQLIAKVIQEEESAFLRTLETGIRKLDEWSEALIKTGHKVLNGADAFLLYDTYGFPLDLTELILKEKGLQINKEEFSEQMHAQKTRSRKAGKLETEDWVKIRKIPATRFIGYETTEAEVQIARYRKVTQKGRPKFHLVFDQTPFYAESGGQIGDRGILASDEETIEIIDTQKENELIIHITNHLPVHPEKPFRARVDLERRRQIANNHTATHLLHKALRNILGTHVEQKGSLVHPDYLRFDFSHFQKLTDEEIRRIEESVNADIRANYTQQDDHMDFKEAVKSGAVALFGEKYDNEVRVISFGPSKELCGGTHVEATGQIGFFKIVSETAVAAGIRRIEAVTGKAAENHVMEQEQLIRRVASLLNGTRHIEKTLEEQIKELGWLRKSLEEYEKQKVKSIKQDLLSKAETHQGISVIIAHIKDQTSPAELKDLAFQLRNQVDALFCLLAAETGGKAHLVLMISDQLVQDKNLDAGKLIREFSKSIQGGGGGQPFLATAGGKTPEGIPEALEMARRFVLTLE
jgi:alanyl-tRNA synthetase